MKRKILISFVFFFSIFNLTIIQAQNLDKYVEGKSYVIDSIIVKGLDLGKLNDKELTKIRRDSFGFVFQAFNLIPTLTAEENITLPSSIAVRKPDEEWINQIVNAVDIGDRLNHLTNFLLVFQIQL